MNIVYTAEALATGEGRNGHARTSDGLLDLDFAIPKEMGGTGDGTNPEQLFAAGYAACFHSALQMVARAEKANVAILPWVPGSASAPTGRRLRTRCDA